MQRRRLILAYITTYIREHAYPPTIREIMKACRVTSTSVVLYHLKHLEADGEIALVGEGVARGIRLTGARFVVPGDKVQVDIDGLVQHGAFVA